MLSLVTQLGQEYWINKQPTIDWLTLDSQSFTLTLTRLAPSLSPRLVMTHQPPAAETH
jgi:hypothetical protein